MGIQINGQTDSISAIDGSLTVSGADLGSASASSLNISGIVTASGGVVVAAGTTAAPSISPTGDSNTGIFFPSADTIAFGEGGVEVARINSSGNVGIGTDNPTTEFHVQDGSDLLVALFESPNNHVRLRIKSASSSLGQLEFADADDADAGEIRYAHSTDKMTFHVGNNTERVGITSESDGTSNLEIANGNLVFSTSGTGIDFSATSDTGGMTSELLDDYEEGTFTPIVRGRTTGGTTTYNRAPVGKYVKIGRLVNVIIDVGWNSATGTGNIEFGGLPFQAHSGPYVRFAGSATILLSGLSWSTQLAPYINDGASHFWLTNSPTSGSYSFVNINSNSSEILLNCTYMVS